MDHPARSSRPNRGKRRLYSSSDDDSGIPGVKRRVAAHPTAAARVEAETVIADMIRLKLTNASRKPRTEAIALAIADARDDEHVHGLNYMAKRQLYGLDPHDYSFKRDWMDDKQGGRIRWMLFTYYVADEAMRATLRYTSPSVAKQRAHRQQGTCRPPTRAPPSRCSTSDRPQVVPHGAKCVRLRSDG